MSEPFRAGFAARHTLPASALAQAFAPASGFAAVDLRQPPTTNPGAAKPTAFAPQTRPKHFSPADRTSNPTEGWDPLDPTLPDEPEIDPFAAARAAGYAQGLAAAVHEAGDRDRALLGALGDRIAHGGAIDRDQVAEQLRRTVLMLVAKMVGEVGIAPDILAGRITAAADLLADKAESGLLRVHPDDVALLEGRLPRTLFAAGDASVARGSFVLETASTVVEDGPALWLEQLEHAIDRVPVPRA